MKGREIINSAGVYQPFHTTVCVLSVCIGAELYCALHRAECCKCANMQRQKQQSKPVYNYIFYPLWFKQKSSASLSKYKFNVESLKHENSFALVLLSAWKQIFTNMFLRRGKRRRERLFFVLYRQEKLDKWMIVLITHYWSFLSFKATVACGRGVSKIPKISQYLILEY